MKKRSENQKKMKIETRNDIRYKAYKEMIEFIDWLADTYPKEWLKYMNEYDKSKESEHEAK